MSAVLDAIEKVLSETDEPLHYQEITQRILEQGLWETEGKTPWIAINARISLDIRDFDEHSRFKRVDRGVYALRKKHILLKRMLPKNRKNLLKTSYLLQMLRNSFSRNRKINYRFIIGS